jgi:hypothetical protein
MTTNRVDDAAMVEPLLNDIKAKIDKMAGDGVYDKAKVYEILDKKKVKAIIPPRKNARIKRHGNKKGQPFNERQKYQRGEKIWTEEMETESKIL